METGSDKTCAEEKGHLLMLMTNVSPLSFCNKVKRIFYGRQQKFAVNQKTKTKTKKNQKQTIKKKKPTANNTIKEASGKF